MATGTQAFVLIPDANLIPQPVGVVTETPIIGEPFNVTLHAPAGSGGKDWSANAPVPPLIGQSVFGGTSTYAAWVLLATVPPNFGACERKIKNNSAFALLVAYDDGSAVVGSQPTNNHLFLLPVASAQAPNDNEVRDEHFKGRIRIFCANNLAWVSVLEA